MSYHKYSSKVYYFFLIKKSTLYWTLLWVPLPIMKMQNACATLFKIKIGFRFQIWFRMRLSVSEIQRQCWKRLGRNKYGHCNKRPRWKAATGDKCWKLLETLPTSFGGWECFGTDLRLVSVHNLPDFSSRNVKLQHPEDLQLLQIWGKCQSFNVAFSSRHKITQFFPSTIWE